VPRGHVRQASLRSPLTLPHQGRVWLPWMQEGRPSRPLSHSDIDDAEVIMRAAVGSGGAVQALAVADPGIAFRLRVISQCPTA
jgi:hypothetical protein